MNSNIWNWGSKFDVVADMLTAHHSVRMLIADGHVTSPFRVRQLPAARVPQRAACAPHQQHRQSAFCWLDTSVHKWRTRLNNGALPFIPLYKSSLSYILISHNLLIFRSSYLIVHLEKVLYNVCFINGSIAKDLLSTINSSRNDVCRRCRCLTNANVEHSRWSLHDLSFVSST